MLYHILYLSGREDRDVSLAVAAIGLKVVGDVAGAVVLGYAIAKKYIYSYCFPT